MTGLPLTEKGNLARTVVTPARRLLSGTSASTTASCSMRRSPTGWHRGRRAGTPHPSSPAIAAVSARPQLPDAPLHPGHRLA